jgi:hypothetical protein
MVSACAACGPSHLKWGKKCLKQSEFERAVNESDSDYSYSVILQVTLSESFEECSNARWQKIVLEM